MFKGHWALWVAPRPAERQEILLGMESLGCSPGLPPKIAPVTTELRKDSQSTSQELSIVLLLLSSSWTQVDAGHFGVWHLFCLGKDGWTWALAATSPPAAAARAGERTKNSSRGSLLLN